MPANGPATREILVMRESGAGRAFRTWSRMAWAIEASCIFFQLLRVSGYALRV